MELHRETHTSLDISSEAAVLAYTHTGGDAREVMARVDLGSASHPIVGGNTYVLNFYIDNILVTPVSTVAVPSGQTQTIIISRSVPLEPGDTVRVGVVGFIGDLAVDTVASLRDATSATISDITGAGSVTVDHDYGGLDNLTYQTAAGAGVRGASIMAYLAADYNAGNRIPEYIQAQTVTDVNGRWKNPMLLDPGSYVLLAYLSGRYGPDVKQLQVS